MVSVIGILMCSDILSIASYNLGKQILSSLFGSKWKHLQYLSKKLSGTEFLILFHSKYEYITEVANLDLF